MKVSLQGTRCDLNPSISFDELFVALHILWQSTSAEFVALKMYSRNGKLFYIFDHSVYKLKN
jgi:hypothetical protein